VFRRVPAVGQRLRLDDASPRPTAKCRPVVRPSGCGEAHDNQQNDARHGFLRWYCRNRRPMLLIVPPAANRVSLNPVRSYNLQLSGERGCDPPCNVTGGFRSPARWLHEESLMAEKITTRARDYAQWYQDVVREAGLAENSDVRGCMVIKPHGLAIWEKM